MTTSLELIQITTPTKILGLTINIETNLDWSQWKKVAQFMLSPNFTKIVLFQTKYLFIYLSNCQPRCQLRCPMSSLSSKTSSNFRFGLFLVGFRCLARLFHHESSFSIHLSQMSGQIVEVLWSSGDAGSDAITTHSITQSIAQPTVQSVEGLSEASGFLANSIRRKVEVDGREVRAVAGYSKNLGHGDSWLLDSGRTVEDSLWSGGGFTTRTATGTFGHITDDWRFAGLDEPEMKMTIP